MKKQNDEIQLRLKAPIIALEKISKDKYLPKVFVGVALDELRKIQQLTQKIEVDGKRGRHGKPNK
jgi:hypothetical protein